MAQLRANPNNNDLWNAKGFCKADGVGERRLYLIGIEYRRDMATKLLNVIKYPLLSTLHLGPTI